MFGQLKDLYNLRKQAMELQKQMASELVTGTSRDGTFSVTLNGNHELVNMEVSASASLDKSTVEKNVKEAHNAAQEKLKSVLAQKFQGMM